MTILRDNGCDTCRHYIEMLARRDLSYSERVDLSNQLLKHKLERHPHEPRAKEPRRKETIWDEYGWLN